MKGSSLATQEQADPALGPEVLQLGREHRSLGNVPPAVGSGKLGSRTCGPGYRPHSHLSLAPAPWTVTELLCLCKFLNFYASASPVGRLDSSSSPSSTFIQGRVNALRAGKLREECLAHSECSAPGWCCFTAPHREGRGL